MKYRPCFQCGVFALAAVGLCVFLHNEIAWILTAAGIMLAAVFLSVYCKKQRLAIILCALSALGCIGSFARAYTEQYEYAVNQIAPVREVIGYAVSPLSDSHTGDKRWIMRVNWIDRQELSRPVDMMVTVRLPEVELSVGKTVKFYTEVKRLYAVTTEEIAASELGTGVWLKGDLDVDSHPYFLAEAKPTLTLMMEQNKRKLCAFAEEYLSSEAAQIFQGMLYGDKYGMEEELLLDFRYSGFAHLLAVSGLHIQMIFGLMNTVFGGLLFFSRKRREISRIVSLILIWGFILLIGCPVSAVRSGIMVTVSTVGYLFWQRSDTLNSLGVSVVVIQLVMPFSICSLGFWMSVLATFGIGSVGEILCRLWKAWTDRHLEQRRLQYQEQAKRQISICPEQAGFIRERMLQKRQHYAKRMMFAGRIVRAFITGIAATIGLLPIYLFYFGYLPLGAILFGPVCSVLFAAIILLGVFFTAFGLCAYLPGLALCARILEPLLYGLGKFVGWVADKPFLVVPLRKEFGVIFCVLAVCGAVMLQKKICNMLFHTEKRFGIGVFLTIFFVLGLLFTQYYQYNIVEVTAVGGYQSRDVVVIAKNRASVFVCGEDAETERNVAAYLRRRGIGEIDHLYLMIPYSGLPDGVKYLRQVMRVNEVGYNGYGLPYHDTSKPIETGDAFLTREILVTFAYSRKGLNAAIRHGEREIVILQDVSLSEKSGIRLNGSDAVFLYDPIGEKDAHPWQTGSLILLSDGRVPAVITSGRTILFSQQTVTVEFDLRGNLHLP